MQVCCTATGTVENVSHCIKIQETEMSKAASVGRDGLFCAQAGKQPHVQQRDTEEYGWQLATAALHDSITVAWLGGKIQHSFGLPTCTQSN